MIYYVSRLLRCTCKIENIYYIDRCDLWGFIREINSGISHLIEYQ
jgi:hypothetical protein